MGKLSRKISRQNNTKPVRYTASEVKSLMKDVVGAVELEAEKQGIVKALKFCLAVSLHVLENDFGKLQKKETRQDNFLEIFSKELRKYHDKKINLKAEEDKVEKFAWRDFDD